MTRTLPLVMATYVVFPINLRPAPVNLPFMTTPAVPASQARIYGYCALLVLIWGSAFTLIGAAVPHIAPIWLVAYRLMLGAIVLTIYIKTQGKRFPPLRDIRWLWYPVLGVTGMLLPFWLVSEGQLTVDSGLAAIIIGAMPLITIIMAHFFTEERMTWQKFIGFSIGFCGIVLLFLPDDFSLALIADWKAQCLILGAAVFYAGTTVATKRAPSTDALVGATMMLLGAAPLTLIAAFTTDPSDASSLLYAAPIAIAAVCVLGVISTALMNVLYLRIVELSGPSLVAKVNYFIAPVSVFLGITLLGEAFKWRMVLALSIIIIGMIVTRGGGKAARKSKNKPV